MKPRQFFVILDSPQLWCELDCDDEVGDSSTIPIAFLRNTFEFCAKKRFIYANPSYSGKTDLKSPHFISPSFCTFLNKLRFALPLQCTTLNRIDELCAEVRYVP